MSARIVLLLRRLVSFILSILVSADYDLDKRIFAYLFSPAAGALYRTEDNTEGLFVE